MSAGVVMIDGREESCPLPEDATLASAFVYVRDRILREGKIVTDVHIDDEPVTWEDGSTGWSALFTSAHRLSVTTDYPIRVTAPLLARLVETLPAIGTRHREVAEELRQQNPSAPEQMADLLGVWDELQTGLDQVCQLHGIPLEEAPWKGIAEGFRGTFDRLAGTLRELKESLELSDMVLSADLLDFELAPLAEDFVTLCSQFKGELERQYPASPAGRPV